MTDHTQLTVPYDRHQIRHEKRGKNRTLTQGNLVEKRKVPHLLRGQETSQEIIMTMIHRNAEEKGKHFILFFSQSDQLSLEFYLLLWLKAIDALIKKALNTELIRSSLESFNGNYASIGS